MMTVRLSLPLTRKPPFPDIKPLTVAPPCPVNVKFRIAAFAPVSIAPFKVRRLLVPRTSIVPPPVDPGRANVLSVASLVTEPEPQRSVPVKLPPPKVIAPFVPKELFCPANPIFSGTKVPFPIVTGPPKLLFVWVKYTYPPPLLVRPPPPLTTPAKIELEAVLPDWLTVTFVSI